MSAAGGQRGLNGMGFGRGGRIGDLRALLVPPDWFFAVRAGVELVGAGEGTLIATTVAGVRRLWDPETGEALGRGAIRPGGA